VRDIAELVEDAVEAPKPDSAGEAVRLPELVGAGTRSEP
jgi:hypothetical protein